MIIRIMVESMREGEFLCKNVDKAWDFLEDLSDKTYEWKTIRDAQVLQLKFF